jgi:hypothetical protein
MEPHRLLLAALWVFVGPLLAPWSAAAAEEPPAPAASKFLRFVEEDDGDAVLESAIVTYERKDGVTVHLVAAVHLGEKGYYQGLERAFAGYDALLYELVKGRETTAGDLRRADRERPGGGSLAAVGLLQRWLRDTLELEFQLEAIDYTRDNFVHADLELERFLELQKERGESLLTLMLRAIKLDLERQARGEEVAQVSIIDLMRIFLSKDRAREWKLLLGRQFDDIEARLAGLEGPDGSVILTERNKAAIRVLEETIAGGKKEIGIFYGAAHMKDIEERVRALGFERAREEWRVAWDMRARRPQAAPEPPRERRRMRF